MTWVTRSRREEAELNLIPLIDIMSVLVAFLLIYSTEVEVVQNSKGITIPQSSAEIRPQQSVVVMITRDQLFVQGELVADIADIRKSDSQTIEQLRQVLDRPIVMVDGQAAVADASESEREITVIADKSLPFEVVQRVMATCTATAYGKVSLAVLEKEKPMSAGGASSI